MTGLTDQQTKNTIKRIRWEQLFEKTFKGVMIRKRFLPTSFLRKPSRKDGGKEKSPLPQIVD